MLGKIQDTVPVKPVCAVLRASDVNHADLAEALVSLFGPVEKESPVFAFVYTDYYRKEMGGGLRKQYMSFTNLIHPETLPSLKRRTNELELQWSEKGCRRVNLDPGYVTSAKLVLASTKDFAHRVYMSDHIYGDVQLRFIRGRFRVSEWTYPDYQTDLALQFFAMVREKFNQQEKIL